MDKEALFECVKSCIANNKSEIVKTGQTIYNNPETGFKEFKTSELVKEKIEELGLEYEQFGNIPGLKAVFDTGRPGPAVAVLGELDSVICFQHPHCNPDTGAVHSCGHCVQIADMIGAAVGLLKSSAFNYMKGKIYFIAVPAEEYIELDYRQQLKERGVIKYFSGKRELLSRGVFNDIDICLMIHTRAGGKRLYKSPTNNGHIVKNIRYIGKTAHAGGAPYEGINALHAANLGINAVNAWRQAFNYEDFIRVNSIITKGGDISNAIPSDVRLECKIRGRTPEAFLEAAEKVERSFLSGAFALGAKVEVETIPGYMPLRGDVRFSEKAYNVMKMLTDVDDIGEVGHIGGCTDLGELSMLMPVLHPYIGGVVGKGHSEDFRIVDYDIAYVLGSQFLACTVMTLLWKDDNISEEIIKGYEPYFKSTQDYFKFIDGLYFKKQYDFERIPEVYSQPR
jgi:amidohydrolase